MDYLLSLIREYTDDPATVQAIFYAVTGLAGVTLAAAISLFVSGVYSPIKIQLERLKTGEKQNFTKQEGFSKSLEQGLDKSSWLPSRMGGDSESKKLLIHAGYHNESALKIYNAIKLFLLLIAGAASLAALQYLPNMSSTMSFYVVAMIVGLGYIAPGLVLTHLANKRMNGLRKFFPDALDLLVVCCESGLGLLEAFQRVSKEMEFSHPELSHELALVCRKVRVGYSMQDALHEFSERTGLEDIRGLNSVIVQSLRLGTGIADTLRVYADEYRDKRLQAAEEKAAKLGTKMLFPMLFCIWPSFFIVAVGPAILKVMSVWDKAF
ncbi:type II secretion system F family protein [Thalassotalea sp. HSM 43]|uniref:type II secretion system F family protein n=1 Tax=Thalassotalea sp. HSM 43 TaxID=2552945 RepID=UPI001080D891|nr:type II secretion system F family protein [Thalassotalea sp. HSM 43]QBY03432.1 type II secretion system F family protein [Thalassotalea sp. HSM 43]